MHQKKNYAIRKSDGRGKSKMNVRDSSEHALEQAEQQIRNLAASHAGLGQHIHETKVGQVTNERAASVTERQAITPEEPLESHNCYTHQG